MRPSVSVVITCYNYGRYVAESIKSVLDQDWKDVAREIVVVDDGSTDETRAEVEKFAPEVRYLYQKNQGQGPAFNAGVAATKGEIVCFQDADDRWYPNKIARVLDAFAAHPDAGFVQHPLEMMDAGGQYLGRMAPLTEGFVTLDQLLAGNATLIGAPGFSIRRSLFEKVAPVPADLPYCSDEYVSKHALFFTKGWTIPEILGCFRIHDKNSYQRTDWSATKIERFLGIRSVLDAHLNKRLAERGLKLTPDAARQAVLERRKKEILLYGWRGERAKALESLQALGRELPDSSFKSFKLATLRLAAASPRTYLSLQGVYEKMGWLARLRQSCLREGAQK
jgi:glycosyltransferase involved in cell wall biosynthesis